MQENRQSTETAVPEGQAAASEDEALPEAADPDGARQDLSRKADAIRLTKAARTAQESGNGAKAVRLYERALAGRSGHAAAAHDLGAIYFQRGDYRAAIRCAKQATGAAPRNGTYRLALGDDYSKSGNDAAARRHWKRTANLGNATAKSRVSSG